MDSSDWPVKIKNLDTGETLDLPGVYQNMSIGQDVIIDEAKAEGVSGKLKQAQGFDDLNVHLSILLPNTGLTNGVPSNLLELNKINASFQATSSSGTPSRFEIISPHTYVRGVKEVIWSNLSSDEGNEDDTIWLDLSFKQLTQGSTTSEAGGGDTPGTNPTESGSGSSDIPTISDPYTRGSYGL